MSALHRHMKVVTILPSFPPQYNMKNYLKMCLGIPKIWSNWQDVLQSLLRVTLFFGFSPDPEREQQVQALPRVLQIGLDQAWIFSSRYSSVVRWMIRAWAVRGTFRSCSR